MHAGNYYKFQGVSIVFNVRPMIVHTESLHTAILHWCEWPDLHPINHMQLLQLLASFQSHSREETERNQLLKTGPQAQSHQPIFSIWRIKDYGLYGTPDEYWFKETSDNPLLIINTERFVNFETKEMWAGRKWKELSVRKVLCVILT